MLWGTEARLRELFGASAEDARAQAPLVFRYPSPEAWVETGASSTAPTRKAFRASVRRGRHSRRDLLELVGRFNRRDDGTMVVPSEYLETVIERGGAVAGPRRRRSGR